MTNQEQLNSFDNEISKEGWVGPRAVMGTITCRQRYTIKWKIIHLPPNQYERAVYFIIPFSCFYLYNNATKKIQKFIKFLSEEIYTNYNLCSGQR